MTLNEQYDAWHKENAERIHESWVRYLATLQEGDPAMDAEDFVLSLWHRDRLIKMATQHE